MDKLSKAEFVKEAFLGLHTPKEVRLANGLRRRQRIRESLVAGQCPDNYRVDYIHDSAVEVISLLKDQAWDFDANHHDDMASAHDFVDILSTAIGMIKGAIEDDD